MNGPEDPNLGKKKEAIPEFSFEKGVSEILKRIREILKTKDVAVIAFSASLRLTRK